jgi:hypothetical protein
VVELVDTRDLKSLACKSVPVQVRPRVPLLIDISWMYYKKFEAAVAQLVEHHVANVNVTSSSLVSRSKYDSYYCQSRVPISTIKNTLVARVVELVDTRDLKSLACKSVPVQVRPRVPFFTLLSVE